jgi:hypothetical protein
MEDNKVVHTRSGSLSVEAAGQIIDELAEALDQQNALEAIERNLRVANAFSYINLLEKWQISQGDVDDNIRDVMRRLATNFK